MKIARQAVKVDRRTLGWWSLGLIAIALMYLAFYPSIAENAKVYDEITKSLPEALRSIAAADYSSPRGYLQTEFFGTMGFIILLVFFVGRGVGAIAGDEERGRSELILAAPVSRQRYLLERALAMVLEAVLAWALLVVALLVLGPAFDLVVGFSALAVAAASAVAGALVFGLIAFFIGAATGKRSLALGVGSAFAVAGFLFTLLSPIAKSLENLQFISPCSQAIGYAPLVNGMRWDQFSILIGEALVLIALSVWSYCRRDLH
jgi:ABC-2 type transport system permease protein